MWREKIFFRLCLLFSPCQTANIAHLSLSPPSLIQTNGSSFRGVKNVQKKRHILCCFIKESFVVFFILLHFLWQIMLLLCEKDVSSSLSSQATTATRRLKPFWGSRKWEFLYHSFVSCACLFFSFHDPKNCITNRATFVCCHKWVDERMAMKEGNWGVKSFAGKAQEMERKSTQPNHTLKSLSVVVTKRKPEKLRPQTSLSLVSSSLFSGGERHCNNIKNFIFYLFH